MVRVEVVRVRCVEALVGDVLTVQVGRRRNAHGGIGGRAAGAAPGWAAGVDTDGPGVSGRSRNGRADLRRRWPLAVRAPRDRVSRARQIQTRLEVLDGPGRTPLNVADPPNLKQWPPPSFRRAGDETMAGRAGAEERERKQGAGLRPYWYPVPCSHHNGLEGGCCCRANAVRLRGCLHITDMEDDGGSRVRR